MCEKCDGYVCFPSSDLREIYVSFSVLVVENCPRLLRNDFESTVCVEYEIAGVIHGLQSLVCESDCVPDRLDVKALILNGTDARLVDCFADTGLCTKLKARFPDGPFDHVSGICNLSILAFAMVGRTVEALSQPFRERRQQWVGFSCICPELIFGGDADTMETEFLEMASYLGVSGHIPSDELLNAQRQYSGMVKAAIVRENRDAQIVPGGRVFATDGIWDFWRSLPGWGRSEQFMRVLKIFLLIGGNFNYEFNFDECEGGVVAHTTWMSVVHCARSYFGSFGPVDYHDIPSEGIKSVENAVCKNDDFCSPEGLQPWTGLLVTNREDLFAGRAGINIPSIPVVVDAPQSPSVKVKQLYDSLSIARGRGGRAFRNISGNVVSAKAKKVVRRSNRLPVPRKSDHEKYPGLLAPTLSAFRVSAGAIDSKAVIASHSDVETENNESVSVECATSGSFSTQAVVRLENLGLRDVSEVEAMDTESTVEAGEGEDSLSEDEFGNLSISTEYENALSECLADEAAAKDGLSNEDSCTLPSVSSVLQSDGEMSPEIGSFRQESSSWGCGSSTLLEACPSLLGENSK